MSKILCVIDGMSDPAFDEEKYPALASFPGRGYIKTVPDGSSVDALPCVLSLLGVTAPPQNIRGWIEALGAGIPVNPDELIFRGSWVELDGDGMCVGYYDAPESIPELKEARYVSLNGYKGLLIFPGQASLAGSIQEVFPFEMFGKHINDFICQDIPLLKDTLMHINSTNHRCSMIPWAPSAMQNIPRFPYKAAAVCATNVVRGIARALDMCPAPHP